MEYLMIFGLATLLVVIVLLLRPVHHGSAIRRAMSLQQVADAEQNRRIREFQHLDTPPARVRHKDPAELVEQFIGKHGRRAAAWHELITRQGGSVWLEGEIIWYSDAAGNKSTISFKGDWD